MHYMPAFVEDKGRLKEEAQQGIQKLQEKNRKSFNKKRKLPQKYNLGVLITLKKPSCDRYDVEKLGAGEGPNRTSTAADFVKPWHRLEEGECLSSESKSDEPGEENIIEPNELEENTVRCGKGKTAEGTLLEDECHVRTGRDVGSTGKYNLTEKRGKRGR
ncbi:hypothetical protein Trydic_g6198 [Trypoxylus dichotomus]